MAYFSSQDEQNQALMKLGYTPMSSAPAVSPMAEPLGATTQPTPPPPAIEEAPAAEPPAQQAQSGSGMKTVKGVTDMLSTASSDPQQSQALKKVGGLVTTIMSMYSGNPAGVKGGIQGMQEK